MLRTCNRLISFIKILVFTFVFTDLYSQDVEEYIQQEQPYGQFCPVEEPSTFDPPLLLDIPTAINIALTSHRSLAAALENVYKAQLNVELADSEFALRINPRSDIGYVGGGKAGLGGTIGGGLDLTQKFSVGTFVGINPYITKDAHDYHSGVKAIIRQPLLRGFGSEYTLSPLYGAQFASRTAFRTAYITGMETILRIITILYDVAKLEELVTLDQEAHERLKKFRESIKIKARIGLADSLDVYRVETEMKHTEDALDSSRERLLDAKDALREFLALPLDKNISIRLPIDYQPLDVDVDAAIQTALTCRMEIEQAKDQLCESRRLSRVAQNNILPDLNLVLDFTNTGRDEVFTNSFTDKRDSRWGVGFTTASDWDRTAQKVAFTQSLFNINNAERNLDQTQDKIILEIKRAIRQMHRANQKIELQREQIRNAMGELKLAKLKFERGRANNFDVIQAEKNLRSSETAFLNAIVDHKIGEYKLYASLGLLADKPEFCP